MCAPSGRAAESCDKRSRLTALTSRVMPAGPPRRSASATDCESSSSRLERHVELHHTIEEVVSSGVMLAWNDKVVRCSKVPKARTTAGCRSCGSGKVEARSEHTQQRTQSSHD